jgi:hypothetical protein
MANEGFLFFIDPQWKHTVILSILVLSNNDEIELRKSAECENFSDDTRTRWELAALHYSCGYFEKLAMAEQVDVVVSARHWHLAE